jgi:MFS transporter, NNP family, nitrate/nitrite transporter
MDADLCHHLSDVPVAALGVGLAGGSFIVGVAYVSRWYPKEKQGTALGIFGVGNVGAAVTKFSAPFVMVAFGWQAVAHVWAAALVVMAIVFYVMSKDDPVHARRRQSGAAAPSMASQLSVLKNLQVWRFSLYYFFAFGAFVALALWLPQYIIWVYDVDIRVPACWRRASRWRRAPFAPMAACCRIASAPAPSCTGCSGSR